MKLWEKKLVRRARFELANSYEISLVILTVSIVEAPRNSKEDLLPFLRWKKEGLIFLVALSDVAWNKMIQEIKEMPEVTHRNKALILDGWEKL